MEFGYMGRKLKEAQISEDFNNMTLAQSDIADEFVDEEMI